MKARSSLLTLLASHLGLLAGFRVAGQPMPGLIAQAQTDAQVEALVHRLGDYYTTFKVSSSLQFADKRVERQYRRAKVKAWVKADIDGDGRLDVLITGTHHDGRSKVICLFDRGDSLAVELFRRQFYRACPIATLSSEGGQPVVRYADFSKPFLVTDKLQDKQSFCLVYKYGGFVEYAPAVPAPAQPDSIVYHSVFAYHSVSREDLILDASGRATYHACTYPVLDKTQEECISEQTAVTTLTLSKLQGLASYLAQLLLKQAYHLGFNHIPHTRLLITYRDGRRLTVEDNGEIGSFGLTQLYVLLHGLRKTQSWQPVKR